MLEYPALDFASSVIREPSVSVSLATCYGLQIKGARQVRELERAAHVGVGQRERGLPVFHGPGRKLMDVGSSLSEAE